jgi:predicted nuclease with TOPRIM domain
VIARCITHNNYNVVKYYEHLEKIRDIVEESEKIVQRLHELPDSNSEREYFNTELKRVRGVIKTTEETIQKLPYSESILKEFIAYRNWLRANIPDYGY